MRAPAPTASRPSRVLWHRHPAVRSGDQLTPGKRAADRLRNGRGSWTLIFAALVFLAGWMPGNRGSGFDPQPFILLDLVLSCLAAMQGTVLLITARRADQISAEPAAHDYATNGESDLLTTGCVALVRSIQIHVGEPEPDTTDPGGPAAGSITGTG